MKIVSKKTVKTGICKGEKLEVLISALDQDGNGIGATESCQVIVRGALPGERLLVKVSHAGKHRIIAAPIKFLTVSPDRRKSTCSHFADCDGCPLMEMTYEKQLQWKQDLVFNQIRPFPQLDHTAILGVLPSPAELHYRNSAKLVIGGRFADPVIGIYKRNSHDILDITDCALHHPLINRIISVVKKGIVKGKVPIYHQRSEQGFLRYLVVRISETDRKAMVVFVTAKRSYNEIHHLAAYLQKEVPETAVIVQNLNPSTGNVIFGNKDFFLTKQTSMQTMIGDVKFRISPRSFFQVNSGSAGIIYEYVRKSALLTGKERVLDLYCGIGAVSLFLAREAASLHGIEVNEAAVEDAIANARLNRISNCVFEAGDAVEQLQHLLRQKDHFDLAVLNPPRKGCDEKVLDQLAAMMTPRIIYVSCSPGTLARDLTMLHDRGYATESIQPVDMFPQTCHVESVAVLTRVPS
jgi:23S rRNA (uracil1939-C5)-methyltransferase